MRDDGMYFLNGTVIAESGDVRVYEHLGNLILDIGPGHNTWALSSELSDYVEQLFNYPRGNVLEIGLGLGVASRYMLSLPSVRALTTVETNQDVINVYNQILKKDKEFVKYFGHKKHTIYNIDGLSYLYNTKRRYDFVFMDFYNRIDEDTLPLIEDMVIGARRVLSDGGVIMGWFDQYTPDIYVKRFNDLF